MEVEAWHKGRDALWVAAGRERYVQRVRAALHQRGVRASRARREGSGEAQAEGAHEEGGRRREARECRAAEGAGQDAEPHVLIFFVCILLLTFFFVSFGVSFCIFVYVLFVLFISLLVALFYAVL